MATTFNLTGGATFPEGTSVGAYPRSAWGIESGPTGAPTGSATATATVTSGVAAFTGLTTNTQYYAYASVGGQPRIKAFNTADPPSTGGGGTPADLSVTPRQLSDLSRTGGWLPTGAIAQTLQNRGIGSSTTLTSGTLRVGGGATIPGGRTVSSISFCTAGAGATTPTNQWFCLLDQSRNVLATTVDDTTTAWAAATVKTLQLATTLGGSTPGGSYTPANAIEVYLGVCVVAGTPPSIAGTSLATGLSAATPILSANSSSGLTTPASLGATAGALSVATHVAYAVVS